MILDWYESLQMAFIQHIIVLYTIIYGILYGIMNNMYRISTLFFSDRSYVQSRMGKILDAVWIICVVYLVVIIV